MNKKYEFTPEIKMTEAHRLHRIRAVRDFADIKAGTLGGWIESEENLSHDGNAWVADEAEVFCKASVTDNARVSDHAMVRDRAQVSDNARVFMKAIVGESAQVREHASIMGTTLIYGNAEVYGSATVAGRAFVTGKARVYGNTRIRDEAKVGGEAAILGDSRVGGSMTVGGKAQIDGPDQILSVGPFGQEQQYVTFYRGEAGPEAAGMAMAGNAQEFLEAAANDDKLKGYLPVFKAAAETIASADK